MQLLRLTTIFASLTLVSLLSGCDPCTPYRSATCDAVPADDIESFDVTVETGLDGTDADIFFCVMTRDASDGTCEMMDRPLEDDFEPRSVQEYRVVIPVAAGQLTGFFLENRGGAIFGNNDWQIRGLLVSANSASGSARLYDEARITCGNEVDNGDTYVGMSCGW